MRRLSNGQCALGFGQTRASDPFKRFKPEVAQPVRQADVTAQSYVERARKAREMLRSMDPEKVKQVIEFHKKLNFFQALALAQREGRLIVPHDVHDRILTETTDEQYLIQNYPVWTGTLAIYEAPDTPFGEQVVFQGLTFIVPAQLQGKTNCALIVEHPDFEIVTLGGSRYELRVSDESIHLLKNFPKKDGWYIPHSERKIPQDELVAESKDARYLWRLGGSYLGPVVRVAGVDDRQFVGVGYRSNGRFGVALMPLTAAPEKSDLHE